MALYLESISVLLSVRAQASPRTSLVYGLFSQVHVKYIACSNVNLEIIQVLSFFCVPFSILLKLLGEGLREVDFKLALRVHPAANVHSLYFLLLLFKLKGFRLGFELSGQPLLYDVSLLSKAGL